MAVERHRLPWRQGDGCGGVLPPDGERLWASRAAAKNGLFQRSILPTNIDGVVTPGPQAGDVSGWPAVGGQRGKQADAFPVAMQKHLSDCRSRAEVAIDLEGRMVVPEIFEGRSSEDCVQVVVGGGGVSKPRKHADGPGPAPAGSSASSCKSSFESLQHG